MSSRGSRLEWRMAARACPAYRTRPRIHTIYLRQLRHYARFSEGSESYPFTIPLLELASSMSSRNEQRRIYGSSVFDESATPDTRCEGHERATALGLVRTEVEWRTSEVALVARGTSQ